MIDQKIAQRFNQVKLVKWTNSMFMHVVTKTRGRRFLIIDLWIDNHIPFVVTRWGVKCTKGFVTLYDSFQWHTSVITYRGYRLCHRGSTSDQWSYHGKSKPWVSGFWWVNNAELLFASCTVPRHLSVFALFSLYIVILSCSFLVHCKVLEPVRTRRVGFLSVAWCDKLPWNNSRRYV